MGMPDAAARSTTPAERARSELRQKLRRTLRDRPTPQQLRAVLHAGGALDCRVCDSPLADVHVQDGYAVTVLCLNPGCRGAHSILTG